MRISEHEADLEDLLPHLEAEHDGEADPHVRAALGQLIDSVEQYLLARQEQRRPG